MRNALQNAHAADAAQGRREERGDLVQRAVKLAKTARDRRGAGAN
jgi:hypothetical protein